MSYRYYKGADRRRFCYATRATRRCTYHCQAPAELIAAGIELGVNVQRLFELTHRSYSDQFETNQERCPACDAKLETIGYRAWIEQHEALTSGLTVDKEQFFGLKREAIAWTREEAALDRSLADEERAIERDRLMANMLQSVLDGVE